LRHYRQRSIFWILEKSHPFFRAVGVPVDHVWRMGKFYATLSQRIVRLPDIEHSEVQNRIGARWRIPLRQHQTSTGTVEEREVPESVQVRQTEHFAVPMLRAFNIADRPRYLVERRALES
jgi:hypothetical protein